MSPTKAAMLAAEESFNAYLLRHKAAAAAYVPPEVIDLARAAFAAAGGKGKIVVKGHGNPTHPVCGVTVRRA